MTRLTDHPRFDRSILPLTAGIRPEVGPPPSSSLEPPLTELRAALHENGFDVATPRPSRFSVPELEAAILRIDGVDGVRVKAKGDVLEDIHVVAKSDRPAKHIARDVVTVVEAGFHMTVDHRVVQVARLDSGDDGEDGEADEMRSGLLESPTRTPRVEAGEAETGRIRFGSVNLRVQGSRAEAEVELEWKGIPRSGAAAGVGTRDAALRLIGHATLIAIQDFLGDSLSLSLQTAEIVRAGRRDIALVTIDLLAHREQKSLAGCCTVEGDVQEAVVLATLAALNRIIGALPTREPTEYVLRPTSQ